MRKTSLFILSLLICAVLCTAAAFAADGVKNLTFDLVCKTKSNICFYTTNI